MSYYGVENRREAVPVLMQPHDKATAWESQDFVLCFTTGYEKEAAPFLTQPQLSTPNRAVLEPILADLDRIWELRHWIPNPGEPILPNCKRGAAA